MKQTAGKTCGLLFDIKNTNMIQIKPAKLMTATARRKIPTPIKRHGARVFIAVFL